jgi:hypothetical protein
MKDVDQLIAQLAEDAANVRPALSPYPASLVLIGAALVYLAISLAVSGLRPDLVQALGRPWFIAEIAVLFMLFITASLSAVLLSFPDFHQKRRLVFAPAWTFAIFLVVILLAWNADNPPAALPKHNIECTSCIVLVALLPTAWTFFFMRKFASTHFHWAGSVAILTAFSIGALWLRLQEVNDSILHVIEWHYLPMLAAGLVGHWMGRWLLRW